MHPMRAGYLQRVAHIMNSFMPAVSPLPLRLSVVRLLLTSDPPARACMEGPLLRTGCCAYLLSAAPDVNEKY